MRDFFRLTEPVHFTFPIDGDFVNRYDGTETDDGLKLTVKVSAPFRADLTVNGHPCTYDPEEGLWSCELTLRHYRNTLVAIDRAGGHRAEIVVFRGYDAVGKTYFTVDDCILCFYELAEHPEQYDSLFDQPFLNVFKTAHDLYGSKTNLHIYYAYDEVCAKDFANHKKYFDLSMMPDKWKAEWEACSDWLTLTYHAHANYPNEPYKVQTPEFVDEDIRRVHREICRFAGPATIGKTTCLHFGNGPVDFLRVFRENGYRALSASFRILDDTEPFIGYYGADRLPLHIRGSGQDAYDRSASSLTEGAPDGVAVRRVTSSPAVTGRDFWYDRQEDTVFVRTDMVLNTIDLERIEPWLEDFITVPQRSSYLHTMIHEEYFYPDYFHYIPDCRERMLTAMRFAYEHGYTGAYPADVILEK